MSTREVCKCCGEIVRVGFTVSDSTWQRSVPNHLIASVLCLNCFTRFADENGVEWDRDPKLDFFPVSFITHKGERGGHTWTPMHEPNPAACNKPHVNPRNPEFCARCLLPLNQHAEGKVPSPK